MKYNLENTLSAMCKVTPKIYGNHYEVKSSDNYDKWCAIVYENKEKFKHDLFEAFEIKENISQGNRAFEMAWQEGINDSRWSILGKLYRKYCCLFKNL